MADLNVAAKGPVQPIVLGDKIITPGADGKTVQVSEKDGSNAQSMDIQDFKKYLAEHKEEIIASMNKGDTAQFSGKKPSFGSSYDGGGGGISTGTAILGTAGLAGLGFWQKDKVVEYWGKTCKFATENYKKALEYGKKIKV